MKKQLLIIPLLLLSCSKEAEKSDVVVFSDESDSALAKIQQADSLFTVKHATYRGKHMHGSGSNAAVHAHQDLNKKKRILKSEAQKFEARRQATQRQNEEMSQRIKEMTQTYKDTATASHE